MATLCQIRVSIFESLITAQHNSLAQHCEIKYLKTDWLVHVEFFK